ncbi:hypothetical protein VNI00_000263 [Paramarasmius palmivorus]|uniref:Uncharacterized protein n=1 Tax=Paramarasmius palmivorus TaxID=297713 RepID=A0AAW0EFM7_9AGAR
MVAPPPAHLHYGGVPLPDPITTNPPTASDIAQAEEFSRAVIYQLGQIVDLTAEEVAEAKKYEFRVLKASIEEAPFPPWVQGLVDRIEAVNARVGVLEATIDARFNEVRDELRAIKEISR